MNLSKLSVTILMFLSLGLAACKSDQTSQPVTGNDGANPQSQEPPLEGGISAGGGGTLPANPIGEYRVVQIVGNAKRLLRMYFNYERKYKNLETISDMKYFFGENNLATQLEKTDIEILEDKPCKDKYGRDVDASIHASRPNTICISAQRIAPKVVEETAYKEILALLVHELAHFLGADEKEAVEIQQFSAFHLQSVIGKEADKIERKVWELAVVDLQALYRIKDSIAEALENNNFNKALKDLDTYEERIKEWGSFFEDIKLSTKDYTLRDYEEVLLIKVNLARLFIRSLDPKEEDPNYWKDLYEKCFENKVTTLRRLKSCYYGTSTENIYQDYTISQFENKNEIVPNLMDVFVYAYDYSQHMWALAFDQPLAFVRLPTTKIERNPWLNFAGNYKVEEIECTTTDKTQPNYLKGLTEIEILPTEVQNPEPDLNAVSVKETKDTLKSWHQFFTHSNDVQKMAVSAINDGASMVSERGSRWYDRSNHGWSKVMKSIERTKDGLFFNSRSEYFTYSYRGVWDVKQSCRYKLIPQ